MGAGAAIGLVPGEASSAVLGALLAGAAILWFAAAWTFGRVVEFEGETEGGRSAVKKALQKWTLLRDDPPFRRFVLGRALAMGSGLAAPFYIVLAREDLGTAALFLGIFVAIEGLAGVISAPVWGRWADQSSRKVFALASSTAGAVTLLVALTAWLETAPTLSYWFYPAAFFLLGLAHSGVRIGRKTYLVDMATGNTRTNYVAVSNSTIGLFLLIAGSLGAVTSRFSVEGTLVLFGAAGLLAAYLALRWKEVSTLKT